MNEINKETFLKYLKQIKKCESNLQLKFEFKKSIKQVKNCEKLLDVTHPWHAVYQNKSYFMSINAYSKEPDGTFKIINITINSEINFKEFEFFLKAKKRNKKINQILN